MVAKEAGEVFREDLFLQKELLTNGDTEPSSLGNEPAFWPVHVMISYVCPTGTVSLQRRHREIADESLVTNHVVQVECHSAGGQFNRTRPRCL